MKVEGKYYRTIWLDETGDTPFIGTFDQRLLPHKFQEVALRTSDEVATAIIEMWVRGAPLIGASAAFGYYLACLEGVKTNDWNGYVEKVAQKLLDTRPTAVNLHWAINRQKKAVAQVTTIAQKISIARDTALQILEEDVEICRRIGEVGLPLLEAISKAKNGDTVNILTHCNAGWIACVDWGTATSPIYQAFDKGIKVHVWVDETRPRNQGAGLTAWELGQHGIPHTLVTDNTGGHLMQHGLVDICIVGTDRTTAKGDVANKIGTYLKALAAKDNNIPFYVALPTTTIDFQMQDGIREIPIEMRDPDEVRYVQGLTADGKIQQVLITPISSPAANYGFDVTPARLITGFITENGIFTPNNLSTVFED
jgi:methylthioribose-1-phosphate isomerase